MNNFKKVGYTSSLLFAFFLGVACVMTSGCYQDTPSIPLHGTITCGGKNVPTGRILFVPLDKEGPVSAAKIVDGQYRVETEKGVSPGKYRAKVAARRKTGRKVVGNNGFEKAMIDEEVSLGPVAYAGDQSPLILEIHHDSDGLFDIEIPVK